MVSCFSIKLYLICQHRLSWCSSWAWWCSRLSQQITTSQLGFCFKQIPPPSPAMASPYLVILPVQVARRPVLIVSVASTDSCLLQQIHAFAMWASLDRWIQVDASHVHTHVQAVTSTIQTVTPVWTRTTFLVLSALHVLSHVTFVKRTTQTAFHVSTAGIFKTLPAYSAPGHAIPAP